MVVKICVEQEKKDFLLQISKDYEKLRYLKSIVFIVLFISRHFEELLKYVTLACAIKLVMSMVNDTHICALNHCYFWDFLL